MDTADCGLLFHRCLNETPWSFTASGGTEFSATRSDLVGGITVMRKKDISEVRLMRDVGEAFAWHAAQIHPKLNGFAGYHVVGLTILTR